VKRLGNVFATLSLSLELHFILMGSRVVVDSIIRRGAKANGAGHGYVAS
jgi:hypothetical protein